MLRIKAISSYIPARNVSNFDKKETFNLSDDFIKNKLGVKYHSLKEENEKSSDLCFKAYQALCKKIDIDHTIIDCCIVVTQNPDYNIPHTSAIVHGKLNLPLDCACFDISLGCSGYVYGLSNIIAFMKSNNLKNGLLFTSDSYSDIIDENDKDTSLLFGDGASLTYIAEDGAWEPKNFSFGTNGKAYQDLICKDKLYMNGRAIFNFTATAIPKHIKSFLEKNNLCDDDIDKYILHQGSKYIVDTIARRLKVNNDKIPFDMYNYGNTVSSSIPIILEKEILNIDNKRLLITGFGVGLSWGSGILEQSIN